MLHGTSATGTVVAAPDARYPAIGEMVMAIEGYLEESGLPADKVAGELARYFKSPSSYELALKERLVDHLTKRRILDVERDRLVELLLDGPLLRRPRLRPDAALVALPVLHASHAVLAVREG